MAEERLDDTDKVDLLVKRKKLRDVPHGGAWKVAYADFVTAMMAFFLLLWLLNSITSDQKSGLGDYFAPTTLDATDFGEGKSGQGLDITMIEGSRSAAKARLTVSATIPTFGKEHQGQRTGERRRDQKLSSLSKEIGKKNTLETENLRRVMNEIRQALREVNLEDVSYLDEIFMDITEEGILVQLIENPSKPLIDEVDGSLTSYARRLLALIGSVAIRVPNFIRITGHVRKNFFKNPWLASATLAVSAKVWLEFAGLSDKRITSVYGLADTEPYSEDPEAVNNTRINILLLNE